jgi:hypothetical protein
VNKLSSLQIPVDVVQNFQVEDFVGVSMSHFPDGKVLQTRMVDPEITVCLSSLKKGKLLLPIVLHD